MRQKHAGDKVVMSAKANDHASNAAFKLHSSRPRP